MEFQGHEDAPFAIAEGFCPMCHRRLTPEQHGHIERLVLEAGKPVVISDPAIAAGSCAQHGLFGLSAYRWRHTVHRGNGWTSADFEVPPT